MTAQGQSIAERPAWFLPGVRMAVLGTVVLLGGIGLIFDHIGDPPRRQSRPLRWPCALAASRSGAL